jgi:hypothetical protein
MPWTCSPVSVGVSGADGSRFGPRPGSLGGGLVEGGGSEGELGGGAVLPPPGSNGAVPPPPPPEPPDPPEPPLPPEPDPPGSGFGALRVRNASWRSPIESLSPVTVTVTRYRPRRGNSCSIVFSLVVSGSPCPKSHVYSTGSSPGSSLSTVAVNSTGSLARNFSLGFAVMSTSSRFPPWPIASRLFSNPASMPLRSRELRCTRNHSTSCRFGSSRQWNTKLALRSA